MAAKKKVKEAVEVVDKVTDELAKAPTAWAKIKDNWKSHVVVAVVGFVLGALVL